MCSLGVCRGAGAPIPAGGPLGEPAAAGGAAGAVPGAPDQAHELAEQPAGHAPGLLGGPGPRAQPSHSHVRAQRAHLGSKRARGSTLRSACAHIRASGGGIAGV